MARAKYIVGIDLGTTNCALSYALASSRAAQRQINLLPVPQLDGPGAVQALPLLPSVRYHALAGELASASLDLPWAHGTDGQPVLGRYARQLGAQTPGRLVSSAKSWLSHPAIDRSAALLPWGAQGVDKISPLAASSSYLAYLRQAWDHAFPQDPLAAQELVLTVPASFDEGARALTLQAAQDAGLPAPRLLEEPQAAFYDWLYRHQKNLRAELANSRLALVVDVGGGTCDFSLIAITPQDEAQHSAPKLSRIGVGEHLMLGGDNMDLALAHLAEQRFALPQKLSASRLAQLMERCRAAKEELLAADAPESVNITLLGSGGSLIGGSKTISLAKAEAQALLLDGFFPLVDASARPQRRLRSGLSEFGLPYASDAAVTRHLAQFLAEHAQAIRQALQVADDAPTPWPDTLLFNGGVFRSALLQARVTAQLTAWRGAPPHVLPHTDPDLAVARGAVAFALARQGRAPAIESSSAHSYFLLLQHGAHKQAVCVLPRGAAPGQEILLQGQQFALRLGQPVQFHLVYAGAGHQAASSAAAGALLPFAAEDFHPLPPLALVLPADAGGKPEVQVQLACSLTELGVLEMHCVAQDGRRWLLPFQLKSAQIDEALEIEELPERLPQALEQIERVFGNRGQQLGAKEVRQLRAQLEQLLGPRERWGLRLTRKLADALLARAKNRRRSVEHEKLWLNLSGYCLRPGFGDALDEWRLNQLWPLFAQGVQFRQDKQTCVEWWTMWRRVAGGLQQDQQLRLLDDFALNLQGTEEDWAAQGGHTVRGQYADMLRLGATLERIPAEYKAEIGNWLLQHAAQAPAGDAAQDIRFWALARLGARVPLHAQWQQLAALEQVEDWLQQLLAYDWRKVESCAFCAAHLARMSGERSRDIKPELRQAVHARLCEVDAPQIWRTMLLEVTQLDSQAQQRLLGESLPPGLRLLKAG
ncbi:Hsp70 family protein [Massilia sp. W12]|uniref:hsp70 family protein n=1 Tax=Massilia sp. W12 TaxID=3126507 RepID=UPI0030CEE0C1